MVPADDQAIGENFVTVLSHAYWETHLGADPEVLNTVLTINGQPMTIVGVAPEGFKGTTLGRSVDVFVPISMRELMSPGEASITAVATGHMSLVAWPRGSPWRLLVPRSTRSTRAS